MKKSLLLALAISASMAAGADNSPYIARVYDFLPAPGQFVNVFPAYKPGYTQDSINAQLEGALCGKLGGSVSLGSFGGYIVFGFDHPVINKHGYDVKIYGNAIQSEAVPGVPGGSCEPGVIMVGVDVDGDGVPSKGDKWYEIKGDAYDRSQHGYEITYYKPDEDKAPVAHPSWRFISDVEYLYWTSNDQVPDSTSGYVWRNTFHKQPYWPLWIEDTVLTFRGTKLPNMAVDMSGGNGNSWFQPFMGEGYVDNLPNGSEPGFMIDWAVDEQGNAVDLDHIDFIKVYTGQMYYCGWVRPQQSSVAPRTSIPMPRLAVPPPIRRTSPSPMASSLSTRIVMAPIRARSISIIMTMTRWSTTSMPWSIPIPSWV